MKTTLIALLSAALFGAMSPAVSADAFSVTTMREKLPESKWDWRDPTVNPDSPGAWTAVTFGRDGTFTATHYGYKLFAGRWEATSSSAVRVRKDDVFGSYLLISFDTSFNRLAMRAGQATAEGVRQGTGIYLPPWQGSPKSLQLARPQQSDPVVGRWRWGNAITVASADGTAVRSNPFFSTKGTWKFLSTGEVTRRYLFNWEGGLWLDTVRLSTDNLKLEGKNQKNKKVTATRVPSDQQ